MTEIPWPKKGDNPFNAELISPESSIYGSLTWLNMPWFDESTLSESFKIVADSVISSMEQENRSSPHVDMLFMPIAYLYRHSLELKLKQMIRLGLDLKLEEMTPKTEEYLESHKLYPLWNIVKHFAEIIYPDGDVKVLEAAEAIIQKFHNLDKSGQQLRYLKDKQGNKITQSLPESVDLIHIKEIFDGLNNLLDGIESGFLNALDYQNGNYGN